MQNKPPIYTIEAGQPEIHYWRDIWSYRELFYFLAWRDILVRYKQTIIGLLWVLLKPILSTVALIFVFSRIANLPSGGEPYSILVLTAMLPWQFFSNAFIGAGESLISNSNMISKVYFPRLIIPFSAVIVSFFDFFITALVLISLMIFLSYIPTYRIFFMPFFVLMVFIASLGFGFWASALNVKYRDFRIVIPFVVQFGLYVTPVGFSSNLIPQQWRLLYSLNPMVGVIDGFRWSISNQYDQQLYLPGFLISWLVILIVFITGLAYFRKTEKFFADII